MRGYDGYNIRSMKDVFFQIGTMKSARDKTLNSTELEVFSELLAQYLIQGKVTFKLIEGHEDIIKKSETMINLMFKRMMHKLIGKVVSF